MRHGGPEGVATPWRASQPRHWNPPRAKRNGEVPLTDPQAAWVARKNTDPFLAYDANYLLDNKAASLVDAEGTRANRMAEIAITETVLERVKDRFDHQPRRAF